jgi:hypothetical protein
MTTALPPPAAIRTNRMSISALVPCAKPAGAYFVTTRLANAFAK